MPIVGEIRCLPEGRVEVFINGNWHFIYTEENNSSSSSSSSSSSRSSSSSTSNPKSLNLSSDLYNIPLEDRTSLFEDRTPSTTIEQQEGVRQANVNQKLSREESTSNKQDTKKDGGKYEKQITHSKPKRLLLL